jgi:hypothetical protein
LLQWCLRLKRRHASAPSALGHPLKGEGVLRCLAPTPDDAALQPIHRRRYPFHPRLELQGQELRVVAGLVEVAALFADAEHVTASG